MQDEILPSNEIKARIIQRGDSIRGLAERWGEQAENITRVINRTKPHVQRGIRKKLARYLGVPMSAVGRDAKKNGGKAKK